MKTQHILATETQIHACACRMCRTHVAVLYLLSSLCIGLLCHKDSEKNATTTVTENTISASYENVNPLTQSTEIDPDYENMSAFEMKECAGCKSDPDYENASAFIMKECAAYKDVNKSVPDYENIPNFKMSKCSAYGVTNKTV